MEKRIRSFLNGSLTLHMTGYSPERFLNLCRARELEIRDLTSTDTGYRFQVDLRDFKSLKPVAKKAGVHIRIISRKGLPFLLHRHKKRAGLLLGISVFLLLFYGLSLFVWSVELEGNRRYSEDTLLTFLSQHGAAAGTLKAGIDCEQLKGALLDEFPQLTWVALHLSGTRLFLSVKEAEVEDRETAGEPQPCNLVAARSGVVERIVTRTGVPLVRPGDSVEAGQVLISGEVIIQDESETELARHLVAADGEVIADTVRQVSSQLPRIYEAKAYTGRSRTGFLIKAGKWSVCALIPLKSDHKWEYQIDYRPLFDRIRGAPPVFLGSIQALEYENYEAFYTESGLQAAADTIYQNIVKNLGEKGVQILGNDVRILEDESACHIMGTIHAKEPIAQVQLISD